MLSSKKLAVIYGIVLVLTSSSACLADELPIDDNGQRKSRFVEDRNPSAATFDKRLPPVIPGEEISDGKDRMNVWSTSGSVIASQPPVAPNVNDPATARGRVDPSIGVIVDQREWEKSRANKK